VKIDKGLLIKGLEKVQILLEEGKVIKASSCIGAILAQLIMSGSNEPTEKPLRQSRASEKSPSPHATKKNSDHQH